MGTTVKIKVCGITREEDALTSLKVGADFIGLNIYPQSPRAVASDSLGSLLDKIPQGKRVMVDVSPSTEELKRRIDLGFDFFQINFDVSTPINEVALWSGCVGPEKLWLAPRIPPSVPFPESILKYADTLVIDRYSKNKFGGTGKVSNWKLFYEWQDTYSDKKWILTGGLNPDNISAALAETEAAYIDINSGVESAPGIKDAYKLKEFFTIARRT